MQYVERQGFAVCNISYTTCRTVYDYTTKPTFRPYIYDYEYCIIIVYFNGNIRILRAKSSYVVYLRNYTITRISYIYDRASLTHVPCMTSAYTLTQNK